MVTLLFFGALRERMGCHEWMIPVEGDVPLGVLLDLAEHQSPGLRQAMADYGVAVAVNTELVAEPAGASPTMIADGDEVALLPPFSGGSAGATADLLTDTDVRIQSGAFSLDAEIHEVKAQSGRAGAIVAFIGTVRDCSYGQAVLAIEVEAYPAMAMKRLAAIRAEAIWAHALLAARIVVRRGRLKIGNDLILIVAAAEHRHEAFLAAHWCIDEIKRSVPIWKRELTPSGWEWVHHVC
jgi:molybdopterin synthase catalytic subunit/molybdopterin converting factor small subunit